MATCSACHAEVLPGVRWCPICHANVLNLAVGKLASPGKRLGAYVLDVVAPIAALFFIFGVGGLGAAAGGQRAGGGIGCLLVVGLLLAYIIVALRLFARGTTPGKRLLGMYVIKENGQPAGFGTMLFREWIGKYFISGLVFGLGYLWILLDKDRQGWHDKLASTYVVERPPLPALVAGTATGSEQANEQPVRPSSTRATYETRSWLVAVAALVLVLATTIAIWVASHRARHTADLVSAAVTAEPNAATSAPSRPRNPGREPAAAFIDEMDGTTIGSSHGITFERGVRGSAARFTRTAASRIQYPTGIPKEGTLEWWLNISDGYFYANSALTPHADHALLFATDSHGGDVTWPGAAKLSLSRDGKITFAMATAKYGRGPYQTIEAHTQFHFGEWHALGVSFGSKGRYIMLDGQLVASESRHSQRLGRAGTHKAPNDIPTIGQLVSGSWAKNQYDGGFEGLVNRFRASPIQRDWVLARESLQARRQSGPEEVFSFLGTFSNTAELTAHFDPNAEPRQAYRVSLWRDPAAGVVGQVEYPVQEADTRAGSVERPKYDPSTGALTFQARLWAGESEPGVAVHAIHEFAGRLTGSSLEGIFRRHGEKRSGGQTERVRLKQQQVDSQLVTFASLAAWQEQYSKPILRFRGPK